MSDAVYIYAFTGEPVESDAQGLKDAPVRTLSSEGIFAIVSDAPSGKIRPQRSLLVGHQRVLTEVAAKTTTLPASFGLVAESEQNVRDMLLNEGEAIRAELDRVGGCVEMSVGLKLDVPNVFEHLVEIDDDLRARRDHLVSAGSQATHDDRVAAGRRVDKLLQTLRAQYGAEVVAAIEPVCREISVSEGGAEEDLFSAACLVEASRVQELEDAIHALAETLDDTFAFTFSGPFAPHNFVSLRLDTAAA